MRKSANGFYTEYWYILGFTDVLFSRYTSSYWTQTYITFYKIVIIWFYVIEGKPRVISNIMNHSRTMVISLVGEENLEQLYYT